MEGLFLFLLIFILRQLFADSQNPADYSSAIDRQAEQFAAQHNYPMAEKTLQDRLRSVEKQYGRDDIAAAVYLRKLALLKVEQGDSAAAESLHRRVPLLLSPCGREGLGLAAQVSR